MCGLLHVSSDGHGNNGFACGEVAMPRGRSSEVKRSRALWPLPPIAVNLKNTTGRRWARECPFLCGGFRNNAYGLRTLAVLNLSPASMAFFRRFSAPDSLMCFASGSCWKDQRAARPRKTVFRSNIAQGLSNQPVTTYPDISLSIALQSSRFCAN